MLFKNLKVLELASVLAGPSVGQFFAELGADVIKVENLTAQGDVTRTWKSAGENTDDRSAYFCCVNWGKRSLAVDLNSSEGKKIVKELATVADIILVSYKSGDAEKLEVDYKTLSSINPGLIYGQITGYGVDNPRAGYDAILQAEAGFMFMNGEPGGNSLKMPVALIDILAGHHLKEGLLLAMLEKERGGNGKLISVSLIHAALSSLANQGSNWLVAHTLPKKQGSSHPNISPYGDVFKTKDNKEILLAVGNDRQFQDLCTALDLKEIVADDRLFGSNQLRVKNRVRLIPILHTAFMRFSCDEILKKIHALKIPAGVIQTVQQALEMPEARELFIAQGELTGLRSFVANISDPDSIQTHILPPPHFGEHTSEILLENLHLETSQIHFLRDKGVIN